MPASSTPPGSTWSTGASSPATGSICSRTPSSPSPPHAEFGGAALIDQEGRLVGIGSLFVNDAGRAPGRADGPRQHVRADRPAQADHGRPSGHGRRADPPRPWLGLTLEEHRGRVFVTRVSPDGPAEAAGIEPNDLILGVDGVPVAGLADFYRKLWASARPASTVPLDVLQGIEVKPVDRRVDRSLPLSAARSQLLAVRSGRAPDRRAAAAVPGPAACAARQRRPASAGSGAGG